MSFGKVPIKAGGGAKRNASPEQGMQVSTITHNPATTTKHHHSEKLSGDTYQPVYLPQPTKREGRGGANCCTNAQFGAQTCTAYQNKFKPSKAWQRPACQIGVHYLQTLLTSIGSILT